jgi:hypothetical protein
MKMEREKRNEQIKKELEGLDGEEESTVYGMEYWGGLGRYKSESSEWEAGLAIAHKDNLPRRILLLRGKDESQLSEDLSLGTEIEISDRDQEVRMRLTYQGQEYLKLKGEADGDYRAEIPFEIALEEYSFVTKGSVAKTEDGEEAALSFYQDGASLVHVKARKANDDSEVITIGNTFREKILGGTISLDYQKHDKVPDPQGNRETLWLRYRASW